MLRADPDPADGRQTLLSLTPAAREKIRASRAAREDWLFRALQSKLTQAEREQLAASVDLLKRLVET
jgi:DNA-binding MarR family transcriptional regulator